MTRNRGRLVVLCGMLTAEVMIRNLSFTLGLFTIVSFAQAPATAPPATRAPMAETPNMELHYKLAPDAMPQEGVPTGEIRGPFTLPSQAYPGTQHTYWVYVPAQYNPAVPASLMIYNDGQAFKAPDGDVRAQIVMDKPDLPPRAAGDDRSLYQSRTPAGPARADA